MRITNVVRKYTAEQGLAGEETLKQGMEARSEIFVGKGGELYAKA